MITPTGTAAPALAADAFVRGDRRRQLELADFRGSWVVIAFGARYGDIVELAELEEAFAADGAIILPATPDDWHAVADRYAGVDSLRCPILSSAADARRITAIVDPG